ncbi:MAG: biotin transporter BioY [Alphaproteobacteria bacterium]|nr:biotin transporter BioY [Alphaproteobacteria bacterium]
MNTTTAFPQQTLIGALWPEGSLAKPLRLAILALAGTALLTLSAKIQIWPGPVPITMQTFVILTIGMTYGWRLGGATLLLYLAEGAVGLPVFAAGGGIAYFAGPTGGYLVGFVLAATLTGWLAERGWDRRPATTALAMLAGNVAVYLPGLIWLSALIGYERAIKFGLVPFLTSDLVKLALAAAVMPLAWKAIRRWRDG